ncbi:hypothetical protein CB1_000218015 [Camelus ferus]|nr:hypothetical protein CB1_000218015 [Camelus ferus]
MHGPCLLYVFCFAVPGGAGSAGGLPLEMLRRFNRTVVNPLPPCTGRPSLFFVRSHSRLSSLSCYGLWLQLQPLPSRESRGAVSSRNCSGRLSVSRELFRRQLRLHWLEAPWGGEESVCPRHVRLARGSVAATCGGLGVVAARFTFAVDLMWIPRVRTAFGLLRVAGVAEVDGDCGSTLVPLSSPLHCCLRGRVSLRGPLPVALLCVVTSSGVRMAVFVPPGSFGSGSFEPELCEPGPALPSIDTAPSQNSARCRWQE